MPRHRLGEIRRQLDELRRRSQQVASTMRGAAEALRKEGSAQPPSLADDLQRLGSQIAALLRRWQAESSQETARFENNAAPRASSLRELTREIEAQLRFARALEVLDGVLSLKEISVTDRDVFARCLDDCRQLRDRLLDTQNGRIPEVAQSRQDQHARSSAESGPAQGEPAKRPVDPEIRELANGSHPYCLLLELAEYGNQLSDERWLECEETIARVFGRQVVTAIVRNNISP